MKLSTIRSQIDSVPDPVISELTAFELLEYAQKIQEWYDYLLMVDDEVMDDNLFDRVECLLLNDFYPWLLDLANKRWRPQIRKESRQERRSTRREKHSKTHKAVLGDYWPDGDSYRGSTLGDAVVRCPQYIRPGSILDRSTPQKV